MPLKSASKEKLFTPWELTASQVDEQFSQFQFNFQRPSVIAHIDRQDPEALGCMMANELSARHSVVAAHCREAYGQNGDKLADRILKLHGSELPVKRLLFLQKATERLAPLSEIKYLLALCQQFEAIGKTLLIPKQKDRAKYKDNLILGLRSALKDLNADSAAELIRLKKLVSDAGYQKDISHLFAGTSSSKDEPERLGVKIREAIDLSKRIRTNIDWIINPESFSEAFKHKRSDFHLGIKHFKAPFYAEIEELRAVVKQTAYGFTELAIWRKMNELPSEQADKIFRAIVGLGLNLQTLWYLYKDIANQNMGFFAANVLEPSDAALAAADPHIYFLKRSSGLTVKEDSGGETSHLRLGILHLRAARFVSDFLTAAK